MADSAKQQLRQDQLRALRALPEASRREASAGVLRRLRTVPEFQQAKRVFSCLAFREEVDTWPLVEALQADATREVYVPRTERATGELHVHRYPCTLRALQIGLREPEPSAPELAPSEVDRTIEVALILGILFDRKGFRLGYGRGCFDRFLRGKSFCTIGLAFEQQLVEALPVEPHDVPLKLVVTEQRVLRFGREC